MKKFLRKLVTGILLPTFVLSLAACSGESSNTAGTDNTQAAAANESSSTQVESTTETVEVRKIIAATSGGPRPLVYTDDNDELTGHNTELLKAVFDRLPQYELELVQVSDLSSVLTGVNSGVYQVGFNNLAKNDEREKLVHYTDPIMVNEYLIALNKNIDLGEFTDLSQLAGLTYVGGAGNDKTTVVEDYNAEHPDAQINIEYSSADLLSQLTDVESGRYDFLIIDAPMYNAYWSVQYPLELNTYSLKGRTSTKYTYFVVGYGDDQLYEDINNALAEVIADGTSTAISNEYLFKDYTPGIADKE